MKTLYFDTNHIDLVGGGGLALYNLSVALQEYFEVHLAEPWNPEMARYEFLRAPSRPFKVGRPARVDVHVASKYAQLVEPLGDANVFYCLYPRHSWDMSGYQMILTLSYYSYAAIARKWGRQAYILIGGSFAPDYGPAVVKRNNFLSCARFFMEGDVERLAGHSKGQHHLIQAFQRADLENWTLTLAGSVLLESDRKYLAALRDCARQDPRIIFKPMATREELRELYAESRVFVHGMGFGRTDEAEVEHYGIVVEKGLLSGCYTIVHNSGGAPELAQANWQSPEELARLMRWCDTLPMSHEKIAREAAARFTWGNFVEKVGKEFHAYA